MGTEAFWIPTLVAALGTGAQAVNQKQANDRQQNAEVQALQDQQKLQSKGAAEAGALTKQIASNTPDQIQAKATGDYVAQLRKNAAGSAQPGASSALAPVAGASSRYGADTAAAQAETNKYGSDLASSMGAMDAAVRQRQNEGLAMQTLGTNLNTLGAQSATTNFVDQLRAQTAGQPNPWVDMAGGLMKNYAASYQPAESKTPNVNMKTGKGIMADSGLTGSSARLS